MFSRFFFLALEQFFPQLVRNIMVTDYFFVYSDFFQWIQYLIAKLMFLTSNWTLSRKEAWFAAWWSGTIGQIRQKCKKNLILDMILNRNFCHVFYLRILDFSGCLGEKGWTFWKSKMLKFIYFEKATKFWEIFTLLWL